jgi:hypothetical protein
VTGRLRALVGRALGYIRRSLIGPGGEVPNPTKGEVAKLLSDFLGGGGGGHGWDDFISSPEWYVPNELEVFRQVWSELPALFPPTEARSYCGEEGVRLLEGALRDLRSGRWPQLPEAIVRATNVRLPKP